MRIVETPVHCIKCSHEWVAQVVEDAPVAVWTASIKAIQCPACGAVSKQIALGRGHVPMPEPVSAEMSDARRLLEWLALRDDGLSSRCIAAVMCGTKHDGSYPRDGDDFGRCERLLERYPAWRQRFHEMREVGPIWCALVDQWTEIRQAWLHDCDLWGLGVKDHKSYRCYALMRSVIDGAARDAAA